MILTLELKSNISFFYGTSFRYCSANPLVTRLIFLEEARNSKRNKVLSWRDKFRLQVACGVNLEDLSLVTFASEKTSGFFLGVGKQNKTKRFRSPTVPISEWQTIFKFSLLAPTLMVLQRPIVGISPMFTL